MTALVTGCAGYIGSVLTGRLLNAGIRVIGVDNLAYGNLSAVFPYIGHSLFEFHKLDVQDFWPLSKLAQRADAVIPLAALVGAPICEEKPEQAVAINHWAVANLVRGLSRHQRVIITNTNSGYGSTDGTSYCTEEDQLNPISIYGRTKCEAEKVVLGHPNSVSLRLATVFGVSPRMRLDLMVNDFTAKLTDIKKGNGATTFEIYEPHFLRNFVGIQDVASAIISMLIRHHLKGVYNLGLPSANMDKMSLAHMICDVIGLSRKVVTVGDGCDEDRRNYLVSNDKILKTGFEFSHSLETGIREVNQVAKFLSLKDIKEMRNI